MSTRALFAGASSSCCVLECVGYPMEHQTRNGIKSTMRRWQERLGAGAGARRGVGLARGRASDGDAPGMNAVIGAVEEVGARADLGRRRRTRGRHAQATRDRGMGERRMASVAATEAARRSSGRCLARNRQRQGGLYTGQRVLRWREEEGARGARADLGPEELGRMGSRGGARRSRLSRVEAREAERNKRFGLGRKAGEIRGLDRF